MSTTDSNNSKRFKMSMLGFLFFSIAGGGFALKGIVSQFTAFGNYTIILYAIAILVYAIPYLFMIFEFVSLKKVQGAESGYQTWMSLILGRKRGFMAGFFYFFVNLFYFLDLIPNLVNYAVYFAIGNSATDILSQANAQYWFKPVVGLIAVIIFWIGTYVSTKGPKWLSKVSSIAGATGMLLTLIFVVAAVIFIATGQNEANGAKLTLWGVEKGKAFVQNDISWSKIGAISWALQAMGGLETMAAYKNDFVGGEKGFRKVISINTIIFSSIFLIVSILVQYTVPADTAAVKGLLSSIFYAFATVGFPAWWTHVIGLTLMVATLSSLMLWTAAPVKMLFLDAPKGIFGKKLSRVSKKDGTPVNGLYAQGAIVTVLLLLQILGSLSSGMNVFLEALRNLDAGSATIPVLFMIGAYIRMRWRKNDANYERGYYFLGKGRLWAILAVMPMLVIFIVATVTGLIPSPKVFREDTTAAVMQVVLGPFGIILAFVGCHFAFKKWRKNNPDDNSLFNPINGHDHEEIITEGKQIIEIRDIDSSGRITMDTRKRKDINIKEPNKNDDINERDEEDDKK